MPHIPLREVKTTQEVGEPAPVPFHVMTKPRGAICNLDCKYCYFLSKENLYPGSGFRMSDDVLEAYTRQYIAAQPVPEVNFAWQGGEPTLMGLDFFERAVHYQQKYARPGMRIQNSLQTNGVTLDAEWCHFLKRHDFLVGLSIDGPQELHDAYRVDKGNRPTFERVMRGMRLLQEYDVSFNTLTTVHAANADYPLEVYGFLRDEAGSQYMQFIPIVERENETGFQEGNSVTNRSVGAEQYGRFLTTIFDEWVQQDVGEVFVQIFDVALGAWMGQPGALCIFAPTCGTGLALEHNGDLYACDHYVEPDYLIGNVTQTPMVELVMSEQQRQFGQEKQRSLPAYCRSCEVRFACHGGCPKNRFINTPDGEPNLNYLCAGYRLFFNHIDRPMRLMAQLLRQGRPAAHAMPILRREAEARFEEALARVGRNDPCPCRSGRKFKHCHGRR